MDRETLSLKRNQLSLSVVVVVAGFVMVVVVAGLVVVVVGAAVVVVVAGPVVVVVMAGFVVVVVGAAVVVDAGRVVELGADVGVDGVASAHQEMWLTALMPKNPRPEPDSDAGL